MEIHQRDSLLGRVDTTRVDQCPEDQVVHLLLLIAVNIMIKQLRRSEEPNSSTDPVLHRDSQPNFNARHDIKL